MTVARDADARGGFKERVELPTPCVIYAAKSTEDRRGSIDTQIADGHRLAEREGWRVLDVFADEGFSAFSGNRGEGLERAERHAAAAAAEFGRCFVVGQHSDRIARGAGDAPGAADHLVEVVARWNRLRVILATDQDDEFRDPRTNLRNAALQGQRNTEDSRRKGEAVTDGLERGRERGDWLGGRVPDGYAKLPRADHGPRELGRDPERWPVIRRVLDLGLAGRTSGTAARELKAAGLRARKYVRRPKGERRGEPEFEFVRWEGWRVRAVWALPHYAGLMVHDGEVVGEGNWPRLIEPADWHKLQRITAERARVNENQTPNGSRRRHADLMAGLCRCGECGSAMHTIRNAPRVDGTQARFLHCAESRDANGGCSAPRIRAEAIEAPFVGQLDAFAVDLDALVAERASTIAGAADALAGRLGQAEAEVERIDRLRSRVQADYLRQVEAGDDGAAQVASTALADLAVERERAEVEVAELRGRLAAAETTDPAGDDLLDAYSELTAALRGHVTGESVEAVNGRLREALSHVVVTADEDAGVTVQAHLSPAFLAVLAPPPDGLEVGTPEAVAEAYTANVGLPAEAVDGGVAVDLSGASLRPLNGLAHPC